MKEFITEIETETGSFICSDYPFKKETGKRKIKTVRYYGRRDAPDIICCLKNCGGAQSELKVSLENNTANALVINKIKSAKIFEDGDGLLGDLQPDIWLFRQGTSSPGDEVKFIPVFKRSKVPDTSTIEKDWYKEFKYYKEIFSETFAVFQNLKTKKTLLLGFVSLADQQTRINVVVRGDLLMLEAVANTGGYLLSPGEKLSAEVLQIATGTDANKLIRNYIDTVTAKMKPKFSRKVPAGWSSWQYYRRNVTEADVLENIKALKDDKYPIEYILLDDGFQKNNAEWHKTNKKFPHGLKWLSGKIQAAGYKPGLWIAPLTILENTEIFKKHKDWLMKDKEGRLLKKFSHMGNVYALDFTMPGACKWLARLMRTLVKDYGFKYIKLDGQILRYYVGGVFSEKNITPV
ncbi:MAG: glycoside hydrolase family 36 protein, partial [Candidatus Firestonebacteria bacterium]